MEFANMSHLIWMPCLIAFLVQSQSQTTEIVVDNAIVKLVREVDVPAEVAGVLVNIDVKEGDRVKKGQVLAKIRDNKIQADLKRSQIELATAKLEYSNEFGLKDAGLAAAVAANEYQRVLDANNQNANTYRKAEVERYKLMADRSVLQVEQAKHDQKLRLLGEMLAENELEAIKLTLSQYQVTAPWAGSVVAVDAVAGSWVEPGTRVVRLIDASTLRIEGFVSSEFSGDALGSEAKIRFSKKSGDVVSLVGKVVFVSPDVNPVNFKSRVFIEVDNADGKLQPGMNVDVSLLHDPTVNSTSDVR
jgi:multidrug efflux pump subunit AcrA (membrane-fusion protein)